jgi:hypothetical protein
MKITVFLDVMSCSLVSRYHSLKGIYYLVFREHRKRWGTKDRNWGSASRPLILSLNDSCPSLPVSRIAISRPTLSNICVLILCTILHHVAYPSTVHKEAAGPTDMHQTT